MDSKFSMLDNLNIYLHHDAITGTAKQFVADDFSWKMDQAMGKSLPAYQHILTQKLL